MLNTEIVLGEIRAQSRPYSINLSQVVWKPKIQEGFADWLY